MNEPIWIDKEDALAIHDDLLHQHGGATGIRDETLLESAVARAKQHYAYAETPDLIDLAAAYTAGIVRNHPFVDGNKRTGFVVGTLFLEMNGYVFTAGEAEATHAVLALASRELTEAQFAAWLRDNVKRSPSRRR
jgi:death-on-curing protein